VRLILGLIVVCSLLSGCASIRLEAEWAHPRAPRCDSGGACTLAMSRPMLEYGSVEADSVATRIGELLETEYGYSVHPIEWSTAVRDSACPAWSYSEPGDGVSISWMVAYIDALAKRGVDVCILVDSECDEWIRCTARGILPAEHGASAFGARTVDSRPTESSSRPNHGWVLTSRRAREHAELLAAAVRTLLTHPEDASRQDKRLEADQPWTKLSPQDEIDRRIWY